MAASSEITTKKSVKIYPIWTTIAWASVILTITVVVTNLSYFISLIPPEYRHYDIIAGFVVLGTALLFSIIGMGYVDTEKDVFKNAAMICGFMLVVLFGILNAKAMNSAGRHVEATTRNVRNLYSIFVVLGSAGLCGVILGNKSGIKILKVSLTLLAVGLMAAVFVYKGNTFFKKSTPVIQSFVSDTIHKTITYDPMPGRRYK